MQTTQNTQTEFYLSKIALFEALKHNCQRPDRVEPIILAYKQELTKKQGG